MIGWWVPEPPVTTGRSDVLVTTYAGQREGPAGHRELGPRHRRRASLQVDWKALGLDSATVTITAPAIDSFQVAREFKPGEAIPVAPARGWLLELH